MNTHNLPARSIRQSEVAHVWVEQLSSATGSFEIARYSTFRVRATGATTVTIDGVLAATMSTGEIMLFNAGRGSSINNPPVGSPNTKNTVTIAIAAAAAFVQVGQQVERPDGD